MRLVAALAAALIASATGAHAAPFTNGSFEDGLSGWTGSTVTVFTLPAIAQDGDKLAAFTQPGNVFTGFSNGTLSQTFDLDPAVSQYLVTFRAAANPFAIVGNALSVVVGNDLEGETVNAIFVLANDPGAPVVDWATYQVLIYANPTGGATSATLFFQSFGVLSSPGALIDDIRITAVPLPFALPMFLAGLSALGILGRRRTAA